MGWFHSFDFRVLPCEVDHVLYSASDNNEVLVWTFAHLGSIQTNDFTCRSDPISSQKDIETTPRAKIKNSFALLYNLRTLQRQGEIWLTAWRAAPSTGFPQLRPRFAPVGKLASCSAEYPAAEATLAESIKKIVVRDVKKDDPCIYNWHLCHSLRARCRQHQRLL